MKKLFFLAFTAFAFIACSDSDEHVNPEPPVVCPTDNYDIISFEAAENMVALDGKLVVLGEIEVVGGMAAAKHENAFWAQPYAAEYGDPDGTMGLTFDGPLFATADENIWFGSYYCDCSLWGTQMDTWGGFALSQNFDKKLTSLDYAKQFSAYADSGANSTATFAIVYYNGMMGPGYNNPTIEFAKTPRCVEYLYMALSSVAAAYYKTDAASMNRTVGYRIIGSLEGAETGSIVVRLVKKSIPVEDWVKVDLSSLGEVDKLLFKPEGFNPNVDADPSYFCIDEIALQKIKK